MSSFNSGIPGYVHAVCTVDVWFPIDDKGKEDICCRQCPYFAPTTRKCDLNDKLCEYPDKYVGSNCPLERKEN